MLAVIADASTVSPAVMKQVFQNPKAGTIQVRDVPAPALRSGTVLVQTACSAISPGTERNSVRAARGSYLQTARSRPDLVRKVLDLAKKQGVKQTWQLVQRKLGALQAMGYSNAGTVMAVSKEAGAHFAVGDRVACAGVGYASHAQVVCVPTNLVCALPDAVDFESAAFGTLGSIALQGVRQAESGLADRVAVIGLGIVGLLTVQLLKAQGARVAAYDLDAKRVALALEMGAEVGLAGGTDAVVASALAWSGAVGVDAVIVAASSQSDAPMVAAAAMARDRGRVVAVGNVPYGLPRDIAFAKELDLRISRSYGPGRYDTDFEENGVQYPVGWVRWTETANLGAVLHGMSTGALNIGALISHRFSIDDAPAAYDMLVGDRSTDAIGIVLTYPDVVPAPPRRVYRATPVVGPVSGPVGVGFVGAGNFARATLLPPLKKHRDARLVHVATATGLSAHDVQRTFGFESAGTDADAVLNDPRVHLVFIATRHDAHAELAIRALQAGKHVFVEKPLALTTEQLDAVAAAAADATGLLMVGYNRRFSPMVSAIAGALRGRGPRMMTVRVNAGDIGGHWLNNPEIGGGRMIGEGCHFVDLLSALTDDARIVEVRSQVAGSRDVAQDFAVQLGFEDGSVGQILYTSLGDTSMGKERVEVFAGGVSAWIDDFTDGRIHGSKGGKLRGSSKGHGEEIDALLAAVKAGGVSPIPLDVLVRVSRATFAAAAASAADTVALD
jgi:predicted dehydrogenase